MLRWRATHQLEALPAGALVAAQRVGARLLALRGARLALVHILAARPIPLKACHMTTMPLHSLKHKVLAVVSPTWQDVSRPKSAGH